MGGNAIDGWRDEHRQSLRAFLHLAERQGELRHVRAAVDPRFELSAYLSLLDGGPALLFHAPVGHAMAVVGNVLATRGRCALALGVDRCRLYERLRDAASERVSPVSVPSAPCRATIVETPDLGSLPVPTFFEHETGPYITAGIVVARDPESGGRNVSIARLKLIGGHRAMIGIAPNHHLALFARRAAARGRDLEIAVTIGNHPAVMLAACLYLDVGEDEFEAAGVLLGEPLDLVRCTAVDLEVPAHCELVLEGVLRPAEMVEEGPVSEFHGMYERYGSGYVAEFGRLTRRSDAFL